MEQRIPRRMVFALALVLLAACGGGGGDGPGADPGRAVPMMLVTPCTGLTDMATFELTLTGTWTPGSHPSDYPVGAHFSPLVGAAHGVLDLVWVRNGTDIASNGIEDMAETGNTGTLGAEIDTYIAGGLASAKILGSGIGATGVTVTTFTTTRDHPLLSVTTMLAPSPDWFVGVANYDLCDSGDWVDDVTIDLTEAYDAGTDNGTSFGSPNADQTPHLPIGLVADEGQHFLGPTAPLATLRIRRLP